MARNPRPVAVAKAPKAIPNDEFSSPVLGSAWLPRLWLGSFTSEVDSEADTEALVDADAERLADVLNEVEILVEVLVLSEALKNADVEACLLYTSILKLMHFLKQRLNLIRIVKLMSTRSLRLTRS